MLNAQMLNAKCLHFPRYYSDSAASDPEEAVLVAAKTSLATASLMLQQLWAAKEDDNEVLDGCHQS